MMFGRKRKPTEVRPVSPVSDEALNALADANRSLVEAKNLASRARKADAVLRAHRGDEVTELFMRLLTAQDPNTGTTDG